MKIGTHEIIRISNNIVFVSVKWFGITLSKLINSVYDGVSLRFLLEFLKYIPWFCLLTWKMLIFIIYSRIWNRKICATWFLTLRDKSVTLSVRLNISTLAKNPGWLYKKNLSLHNLPIFSGCFQNFPIFENEPLFKPIRLI